MIFWAIQDPSTGHYLPAGDRGKHTLAEPGRGRSAPRLFVSSPAAKRALTWWLKGISYVVHTKPEAWGGDYDEEWELEKQPDRADKNLQVVKVRVSVAA